MHKQKRNDFISALILSVFWAILLLYILPVYVDTADGYENTALPPSFWPKVVIVFGLFCSCILLCMSALELWREKISLFPKISWAEEGRALLLMLVFCFYMYGIEYLGLLLASAVFLPVCSWVYGERKPFILILFSLVTITVFYVFFVLIAQVQIPQGLWFAYFWDSNSNFYTA